MASNLTVGGVTTFDASRNLVPKVVAKQLMDEIYEKFTLKPYVGRGSNSPIQTNTDFTRKSGTMYYFGLSMQIDGDPRTGDDERAGHEKPLSIYDDSVSIKQMWQGMSMKGKEEEQKYTYDLHREMRNKLSSYFARILELYMIKHLVGDVDMDPAFPAAPVSPSSNRRRCVNDQPWAGDHAGVKIDGCDNIVAADVLDVETIRIVQYLMWNATVKCPPAQSGAIERYIGMLEPSALYWLERDPVYLQMIREAAVKGNNNPLFTGAIADIHGMIIRKNENLRALTNGTVVVAENVFIGAQAGVFAKAKELNWHDEMRDMNNRYAVGADWMWGFKKCRFNSEDYSTFVVLSAAPTPTES